VGDGLMARVRRAADEFFAMPLADKERISIMRSPHNRGYSPLEEEKLDPTRKGDLKEMLNIGRELAADDPDLLAGKMFHASTNGPTSPPISAPRCSPIPRDVGDLRRPASRLRARPRPAGGFLFRQDRRPLATLRLLHYPPHPGPITTDQYGAAPHTDYGNVTVLWQDDRGGLEVRARSGEWISAVRCPVPSCAISATA